MTAPCSRTETRHASTRTAGWRAAWRAVAALVLGFAGSLCHAGVPGLAGSYYNNTSLTGTPALTRTDSTVAFNWSTGSPGSGVNTDGFSVRWTGFVRVATTGSYNFQTVSDDGVRLYVNNLLVINNWTVHGPTTDTSAAITLTAGTSVPITLEFFDNTLGAQIRLNWRKPGDAAYAAIPADDGSLGLYTGGLVLAEYRMEEAAWNGTASELRDTAGYAGGSFHGRGQGSPMPTGTSASPARSGDPGTCRYATLPGPAAGGGSFIVGGLPVSTTTGAQTTVAFWMYWDGTGSPIPVGWSSYVLWITSGYIAFNTNNSDLYGVSSSGLANGWHHVVATFTNGSVTANKLYIDGAAQTLTQVLGSPNLGVAVVTTSMTLGGDPLDTNLRLTGRLDEVRVYNGALTAAEVTAEYNRTEPCSTLVAQYRFEEDSWAGTTGELKDSAGHASGPYDGKAQGSPLPTPASASPALTGNPGTCGFATLPGPSTGGGNFVVAGLPLTTVYGSQTSVAFWMYWDGTDARIAVGFNGYVIGMLSGGIGFNTNNSDLYGTASTGLANGWHHVAAVFTNGSVTLNRLYINGALQTLTQRTGSPLLAAAVATTTLNVGGYSAANTYRFAGRIDELKVYNGAISAATVATLYAERHACSTGLIAQWDFESITSNTTPDSSGNGNTLSLGASGVSLVGGVVGNGLLLNGASPASGASTTAALDTKGSYTVAAWVKFTSMTNCLAQAVVSQDGVTTHAFEIVLIPGCGLTQPLFFEIMASDSDATAVKRVFSTFAPATNTWYHVAGVRDATADTMSFYVNCTLQGTASGIATYGSAGPLTIGRSRFSSSYRDALNGTVDQAKVWNYALSAGQIATECSSVAQVDHFEIQHDTGNGLTCTPSTLTVRACRDAACTTLYTGGASGTLTATGAGMTVNWPTGAAFTIPSGSSSVTETLQVTTAGSVVLGLTGGTPTATNATTCNFGSPSCTFTAADAGLIFDVPNHRAEVAYSVSVTAVKKSDNSASCVPAFAGVSKAVNFKCAYVNPSTGTQAVRMGSTALNSANNAGAACDGTGQAVTLAFDSTGKANATVTYADAGNMTLTGTYTGSGADAGLTMTGSDTFIAAPYAFGVTGPASGNIVAAANFAGSVTAKNYVGNTTPNFGRETAPEGATLGWVRTQPQGGAAVNGAFTGSLGGFTNGVATSSTLKWSEVGRGELSAVLTSGSYLGSGMQVAGSSNDATWCSEQLNTCTLPTGATAVVYYGYGGRINTRTGVTGSVSCSNGVFGDPWYGEVRKFCSYYLTSGSSAASTGAVGPFIPHHFDVTAVPACSSTFSYAGQPFATTVTARNANNATTVNYDGSANTSPNFAKVTTLSDSPLLGLGAWSNASVPVSAFALGVASATPSYAFTNKATGPQSLVLRADNADAVSSLGYAEPTMPLRSGRLTVSNAFGSEKTSLAIPVQAQYWSGLAWVQNTRRQLHHGAGCGGGARRLPRRQGRGQHRLDQHRLGDHARRRCRHADVRRTLAHHHRQPRLRAQPRLDHHRPELPGGPPVEHRRRPGLAALAERRLLDRLGPRPLRTRHLRHLHAGNAQDHPCARNLLSAWHLATAASRCPSWWR